MNVSVVIATFGDDRWPELARKRAWPSAVRQYPAPSSLLLLYDPHAKVHVVRNEGAARARGEWLCFLDADDELEPGYFAAMAAASGDLRAPAIRFVVAGEPDPEPTTLHTRNIDTMNPCAIRTLLRRSLFDDAGAFWAERAWEDWSLFRRCWLLGAVVEHVPGAVYRANVNPAGRNSTVDRPRVLHREIVRSHTVWLRSRKAPQ
jgi:glycosyltransferase involved in cell wall biosynthesis